MNENGTGGRLIPVNAPRGHAVRSRCCRGAAAAEFRSSAGPTGSPRPLIDSASSLDGGSSARPAGRCSRPTCTRPLRNVPVVTTTRDSVMRRRLRAQHRRPGPLSRQIAAGATENPADVRFGLERRRTHRAVLRACPPAHAATTPPGPRLRLSSLNWMPVASIARPINPPSASISRTRWPFAVPPTAGLQGICPTVSGDSVHRPTLTPRRAAAHAASTASVSGAD